eukprot:GFUD01017503.1.p1 GENE.GFUD01017503.1~~GFUD01017503.1.p1  ORF type:complete len:575 (-),score=146.79 GFUD01017503.1:38-1528(-)
MKDKIPYPKHVFFILGNELCERYSFYGMKAILILYLTKKLMYSKDKAYIIYHTFNFFCYFMPMIGSFLSDQFIGKFKTIVYLSLFYVLGHCIKTMASMTSFSSIPHKELTFAGLGLIAIGTGGIKPCVAAFAGDQFVLPDQASQLQSFFSIFYMSINLGSLFSMIFGPMLRTVHCLGEDDCYPLAFGVPAALMTLATIIIVIGKPFYTSRPCDGIVTKSIGIIWKGIMNKCRKSSKSEHWLDCAKQKYGEKLVEDVKPLIGFNGVLILFVPLILFWALYDQSGSRWVLQADDMDGKLGNLELLPEQLQFINPALILILVPIFDKAIYPLLAKWNILVKPLQRMTVGLYITAVAFGISGVLDLVIQSQDKHSVHRLWQFPQYLVMTIAEILISITGLEFAYNQAPASMKSIIQAFWLLSIGVGNLMDALQAFIVGPDNRASEIFLFTRLMILGAIIFTFMAWNFVPREARLEIKEGEDTKLKDVGETGNAERKKSNK